MSGTHTKDHWEVLRSPGRTSLTDVFVIAEGGLTVCEVTYQFPDANGETERLANAHLIAAAPDLLEALILLEHELVESGNARSRDYGWKPAIEKTRAAIAKATGSAL